MNRYERGNKVLEMINFFRSYLYLKFKLIRLVILIRIAVMNKIGNKNKKKEISYFENRKLCKNNAGIKNTKLITIMMHIIVLSKS